MSVFICWSGERSHRLAHAVKTLIVGSIPSLRKQDVFISDNIDKGAPWRPSIDKQLEAARAGIICLTAENLQSPWLHFEAGALTRRLNALPRPSVHSTSTQGPKPEAEPRRLFTILHGVTGAALVEPLSTYQSTVTTEGDMGAMVLALARALEVLEADHIEKRSSVIPARGWNAFKKTLDSLTVPASDIVRELHRLFQHKTFNEPVHRCTDQAWVRRYDRARDTHEQLLVHQDRVRAACSSHEHALFSMLLTELDGYEMTMQSLLFRPRKFKLAGEGTLKMDEAVRTCCEDRRLAIRSLATLLLHPLDEPLRQEAVRFMGAETNEERKMIVHRLEGAIRRQRETIYESSRRGAIDAAALDTALVTLTGDRMPIEFRASSWDLDRIYYYLLLEYFTKGTLRWKPTKPGPARRAEGGPSQQPDVRDHDWLCAARDVQMEVERYRAKSKGGSLMPLTYALSALQELHFENSSDDEVRLSVQRALDLIEHELGSALVSQPGGETIRRLVANIRDAGHLPSPTRGAAATNPTTAARAARTANASPTVHPSPRPRHARRSRRTHTGGRSPRL